MSAPENAVSFTAKQAQRQRLEQTTATQPGHDGHQAEKQAQHAEVEIEICRRGGRHKKSGGQRGQRRAAENGLLRIKFKMRAERDAWGTLPFVKSVSIIITYFCAVSSAEAQNCGRNTGTDAAFPPAAPGKAFAVVQTTAKRKAERTRFLLKMENK